MSRLLSSDERSAKHLASTEVRSDGSWKVDGVPTYDQFIVRSSERLRSSPVARCRKSLRPSSASFRRWSVTEMWKAGQW